MIDEIFPELPFDLEGPSTSFKPYKFRAAKATNWLRQNWLPICGIIIGLVIA